MLFAGHMALAYFLNQTVSKKWKLSYSLPLLFCASILPDLDFILSPVIVHHTVTHSLTFWTAICLGLIIKMRINGVPYAMAILSHFLVGDIITGNPTLFYGFSNQTFGNFSTTLSSD
jgi:LexA-binding, inner membrane-associated putative hydrolase